MTAAGTASPFSGGTVTPGRQAPPRTRIAPKRLVDEVNLKDEPTGGQGKVELEDGPGSEPHNEAGASVVGKRQYKSSRRTRAITTGLEQPEPLDRFVEEPRQAELDAPEGAGCTGSISGVPAGPSLRASACQAEALAAAVVATGASTSPGLQPQPQADSDAPGTASGSGAGASGPGPSSSARAGPGADSASVAQRSQPEPQADASASGSGMTGAITVPLALTGTGAGNPRLPVGGSSSDGASASMPLQPQAETTGTSAIQAVTAKAATDTGTQAGSAPSRRSPETEALVRQFLRSIKEEDLSPFASSLFDAGFWAIHRLVKIKMEDLTLLYGPVTRMVPPCAMNLAQRRLLLDALEEHRDTGSLRTGGVP